VTVSHQPQLAVSSSTIKVGPSSISNRGTGSQSAAVKILTCNQSLDEDEQIDIEKLKTMFPDFGQPKLDEAAGQVQFGCQRNFLESNYFQIGQACGPVTY